MSATKVDQIVNEVLSQNLAVNNGLTTMCATLLGGQTAQKASAKQETSANNGMASVNTTDSSGEKDELGKDYGLEL